LHQQKTKPLYFEVEILLKLLLLTDLKMKAHEDILDEVAKFEGRALLFDVPALREEAVPGGDDRCSRDWPRRLATDIRQGS
jgi:hypothetical protein